MRTFLFFPLALIAIALAACEAPATPIAPHPTSLIATPAPALTLAAPPLAVVSKPVPTATPVTALTLASVPDPIPAATPLPSLPWDNVPTSQYDPASPCGGAVHYQYVFPHPGNFQKEYLEWTSDGKHVLFDHGNAIYRVKEDGSHLERVAHTGNGIYSYGFHADVSPDNESIAYATCGLPTEPPALWKSRYRKEIDSRPIPPDFWRGLHETYHYEIAVSKVDGTGFNRLTENIQLDSYPSWSPDGNRIAFIANTDEYFPRNGGRIFTMGADGADVRPLTPPSYNVSFSPRSGPPTASS